LLSDIEDAYGHQLYDYFKGKSSGLEIVERDDGFIQANFGPRTYLSSYKSWSNHEKAAMKYARGRILDIGCGGGRHSLYLQKKGHSVLGVDASPLAIRVCKERGLENALVRSIEQLTPRLGTFDTILMMGNNFGLFHNPTTAKKTLKRFGQMAGKNARIIAESMDPYPTTDAFHLAYHKLNRKRGRVPGQVTMRIRYRKYCSPWFDYLLVSRQEMKNSEGHRLESQAIPRIEEAWRFTVPAVRRHNRTRQLTSSFVALARSWKVWIARLSEPA